MAIYFLFSEYSQSLVCSVLAPCLYTWTWYGLGMDLTRSWYGLGYIRTRTKRKKCHALPLWLFGIMAISRTRERHTYNTEYKSCILLQFKTQKHIFYFNLKHKSNKQTFCKSQKPTLLYQFEIKLILLPSILIAIIGITTE